MQILNSFLEEAAQEIPDRPLFIFPETRWTGDEKLTFAELHDRSLAAARLLNERVSRDCRALLLFQTGAAFWEGLLGCFAAGVVAVPLKVPNFNRPNEHLERVCRQCTPAMLLMDDASAEQLHKRRDQHPYLAALPVLTPDTWRRTTDSASRAFRIDPTTTAFLQYTSGSTSAPKGVQVSHANLLANMEIIRDRMGVRVGEERTVTWLPHYHDMGLVGACLASIFTRTTAWCLPPEEFALRPQRWLQLISEHGATICGAPDFAYRFCADRITGEQLQGVDLSSWRVAFNGAERIRPETLRHFQQRFGPYGFRQNSFFPCYGLAESTLMVTGGPAQSGPTLRSVSTAALQEGRIDESVDKNDVTELVGSGGTVEGTSVVVVGRETGLPLEEGQIGQVLISGRSVTDGYCNQPDINDSLFVELFLSGISQRFLKTGDLGFLSRGELFITGRMQEMMIIRGRNLYPEDVEDRVCRADEILQPAGTAAFSIDLGGQESLILAVEVKRTAVRHDNFGDVLANVRQAVVEAFGVNPAEVLLLRPGSIPRTSSGKPRRMACRSAYVDGTLDALHREQRVSPPVSTLPTPEP